MRKFTLFLSFVFAFLTASAQEVTVTSLDQLSNDKTYFIESARCFLMYNTTANADGISTSTATNLGTSTVAKDWTDANQQFKIENIDGSYYLYSVGAAKYVTSNGGFSDTATDALGLTPASDATYNWKLTIGGNGMNSQEAGQMASGIVVNSWTTEDPGNRYKIIDAEASTVVVIDYPNEFSEFDQNKCYTVTTTSRGGWAVANDAFCSTNDAGLGTASNPADANQQFAVLSNDGENYYLYSVGAKKFVKSDKSLITGRGEAIELADASSIGECRVRVNFKGYTDKYINLGGSKQMMIDNWSAIDAGNAVAFIEAGDFDPTEALAMLNNVATITYQFKYEGNVVATQEVIAVPGEAYPDYTLSAPYGVTGAAKPEGTVSGDETVTIELTITKALPFEAVAEGEPTKWYYAQIHGNNLSYMTNPGVGAEMPWKINNELITVIDEANADNYTWGFVGNLWTGFKMVSKAGGAIKSTGSGNITIVENIEDATPFIAMTPATGNNAAAEVGFCLLNAEAGQYINAQNVGVNHWTSNDAGSTIVVTEREITVEPEPEAPFEVVAVTPTEAVAELSTITVEFSEEIAGTQDVMAMETIYVGSKQNACNFTVEGKVLTITLWTPITTPGEYALKVPAGVGITRVSNGEAVVIDGEITFTVEAPAAPFEVVAVTPNEAVAELSTITVEFSEEIAGTQDVMAMETIYVGSKQNACNFTVEGKVLTITLWTPITTPGEYALKVPAGVGITRVSNGEAVVIDGEITFTVEEAVVEPEPFDWAGTYVFKGEPTSKDGREYPAEFEVVVEFVEANAETGQEEMYLVTSFMGNDVNAINYGGIELTIAEDGKSATLANGNVHSLGGGNFLKLFDADGAANPVAITLNEDGTLTMADFTVVMGAWGNNENNTLMAEYKNNTLVKGELPEPEPEPETFALTADLYPAVEGDITEIRNIRVQHGEGASISELPTTWTLTNEAGDSYEISLDWGLINFDDIFVAATPAITEAGTYTLTIPAGSLTTDNGKVCEAATFSWTVVGPVDPYMPYNNGTRTNTGRVIKGITLTGASGVNSYALTENEQTQDYTDATAVAVFKVAAGEELTITFDKMGEWIHQYVFIDYDGDGFTASIEAGSSYAPAEDLVAYSFYNNNDGSDALGWNSVGDMITGDNRSTPAVPAFNAPTEVGTYRMRVKQDWCNIDPAGDADGKFGDFKANGGQIIDVILEVVEAPAAPLNIVAVTPAEDEVVNSLREITIEFDAEIAVKELAGTERISIQYLGISTILIGTTATVEGNTLKLVADSEINDSGKHTLVIPAGVVTRVSDGVAYEGGTFTFTVEKAAVVVEPLTVVAVTPAEAVETLETITIEFSDNVDVPATASGKFTITDADGNTVATLYAWDAAVEGKIVTLTLAEAITTAGEYTFSFAEGLVARQGDQATCAYTCTITVTGGTGIDSINGEAGESVIYDITGRKIEKITEGGIYIVNGKKVLVK